MGGLRMPELLIIFAVLLLLFGGTKLPQLGASLGSAIKNFKRGFSSDNDPPPEEKKPQNGTLASATTVDQSAQAKSATPQS
ncbi:twin-arginine translocase TatA/TatE family subunit [Hyalangium gracile]|uniref:twin-arginine translocase TatA/TatE family subunit n=1 Tax=Hyalangium gracile TaxID=394092 RepID=UPI001CCF1D8E|nr:twin-arginine translocase TatA/TatE family subunit [Hyalangium gracile]